MKLTLEKAKEILKKHTTEDHLFTHAIAVSSAMGAMAEHFGEDPEYWRAIGYLHDVDYEKFPEEHCKHVRELLAPEGVDEEGLQYPLRDAVLTPEFPIGVSNHILEPRARVAVRKGVLIVGWELPPLKG